MLARLGRDPRHLRSDEVDYEGELAVVIGRRVRDAAEAEALRYVAGYMPFNDVSARDFQHRTSQWTIGKTFDSFAPLGPPVLVADPLGAGAARPDGGAGVVAPRAWEAPSDRSGRADPTAQQGWASTVVVRQ